MFTGIITDIGQLRAIEQRGDTRLVLTTSYPVEKIDIGASIACSGACLTVVDKGRDADGAAWFAVDASAETLARTNLGSWRAGTKINLERALRIGDELGGHIVSGHVDALATVKDVHPEGDSLRFTFEVPTGFERFIASKGSVALDGVSLTVNGVSKNRFDVNIIPHTQQATTLGALVVGAHVNLEIDTVARYVARLVQVEP